MWQNWKKKQIFRKKGEDWNLDGDRKVSVSQVFYYSYKGKFEPVAEKMRNIQIQTFVK